VARNAIPIIIQRKRDGRSTTGRSSGGDGFTAASQTVPVDWRQLVQLLVTVRIN
jgi:hypothetical protein